MGVARTFLIYLGKNQIMIYCTFIWNLREEYMVNSIFVTESNIILSKLCVWKFKSLLASLWLNYLTQKCGGKGSNGFLIK